MMNAIHAIVLSVTLGSPAPDKGTKLLIIKKLLRNRYVFLRFSLWLPKENKKICTHTVVAPIAKTTYLGLAVFLEMRSTYRKMNGIIIHLSYHRNN